jgi:hypothetical protein
MNRCLCQSPPAWADGGSWRSGFRRRLPEPEMPPRGWTLPPNAAMDRCQHPVGGCGPLTGVIGSYSSQKRLPAPADWRTSTRALCGKLRKPPATGVEDARLEDSPSGRLIRPISARYADGLSLRVWARILVSRFERRSRQRRGGPSGRERRNISMAC